MKKAIVHSVVVLTVTATVEVDGQDCHIELQEEPKMSHSSCSVFLQRDGDAPDAEYQEAKGIALVGVHRYLAGVFSNRMSVDAPVISEPLPSVRA